MHRCIQLAKNGLGTTYPNPLVGCVIVHNNTIIGEGWHLQAGLPHAEVNAFKGVKDRSLLKNATIYVSLEPCSHHGKTPPCADLIASTGIKNVVIGSTDPNPKVAGLGIQKLKDAGCTITQGILTERCEALNKRFFMFHIKKRPYIILKWAKTENDFIAPLAMARNIQEPVWITNSYSLQRVHKMRAQEQAILVGTTTVLADNPSLTTRNWEGISPIRVVIDKNLKISQDASIFDEMVKTIIITEKETENVKNIIFETISFSRNVAQQICNVLLTYNIQSVIVEGGAKTIQTFIDANLWDEAFIFKGTNLFKEGVQSPIFFGELISEEIIKGDTLQHYKNTSI